MWWAGIAVAIVLVALAAGLNNCLFWAVWQWVRHGGYLCFRRSRHTILPFFHCLWLPEICTLFQKPCPWFQHFAPKHPKRCLIPPPFFVGDVQRGDGERDGHG